ncbi:MAG: alpha-L-rhamnosidase, partial [Anaerophaga sp.]|nr:alpha-L-rhamnosidase [Anaerophaga sp.]
MQKILSTYMTGRQITFFWLTILFLLSFSLFLLNLVFGSVAIPIEEILKILAGKGSDNESWRLIVLKSRLPQTTTAILAGAGLAVGGLQMQTLFRNPLAGPSILGISSGAGLGVAIVLLFAGKIGGVALSHLGWAGHLSVAMAAFAGASLVLGLVLVLSRHLKDNAMLLILGIMVGYAASALIGILKFYSMKEDVHAYVKMANMNFQLENFWHKYLEDIRSGASKEEKNTLFHERYNNTFYFADKAAGIPYMIAPGKRLCGVASPDWGTVQVQLPWWIYVYYGNKQLLSDYYPQMKQWTLYVNSLAKDEERKKLYDMRTNSIVYQGLGDWCPPKYASENKTPVEFTSTAFHYLDTKIMREVAGILGKAEDEALFSRLKEEIATEMRAVFYDPENKTFGSQTADAMALDLGIFPEGDEDKVSRSIVENMNSHSEGFMNCGIFGISRIGSMLARHGNAEAAWQMFTKKGEHSFEW